MFEVAREETEARISYLITHWMKKVIVSRMRN